jgi:hypothetical protein
MLSLFWTNLEQQRTWPWIGHGAYNPASMNLISYNVS